MPIDIYGNKYAVLYEGDLSTQAVWNKIFYSTISWALFHVNKYRTSAKLSMIWPCLPIQAHLKLFPPFTHPTSTGFLVIPQAHKASSYLRAFLFSVPMFLPCSSSSSFFDRPPHICYSCLSSNVPSQRSSTTVSWGHLVTLQLITQSYFHHNCISVWN